VLFSPEQAAKLRATQMLTPRAAILFAADDDADQPLPNALALVRDGESGAIGGLVLRADVLTYPAIDMIAVPSLFAVLVGTLAAIVGVTLVIVAVRASPRMQEST